MNSVMLIVLTLFALNSPLVFASDEECDGVLIPRLSALLEPGVFDSTRLILVEMKPEDINTALQSQLQSHFAPKLANANRTVGVQHWDGTEHLFSTGPFGKNAYTNVNLAQLGAFDAPFKKMDHIQQSYDKTKSYDILFIILNPNQDVYETTLIDDLLLERHWSYRRTGVRKSTVVIGTKGFGGRLHQWSISFLDMFEYLNAKNAKPNKIKNPFAPYRVDIDTFVFPTHRWEGND